MFAGNLAALPVEGVSIAVVRRVAEGAHMTILVEPPMLNVVGNVAPDKIAPNTAPGWTFGPKHSCMQTSNWGVADLVSRKTLIENHNIRIRIANRSRITAIISLLTQRGDGGSRSDSGYKAAPSNLCTS